MDVRQADFLGQSIGTGDQVVARVRYRSGSSSYNHALVQALVMGTTAKQVRVRYWHPRPWGGKQRMEDGLVSPDDCVRIADKGLHNPRLVP